MRPNKNSHVHANMGTRERHSASPHGSVAQRRLHLAVNQTYHTGVRVSPDPLLTSHRACVIINLSLRGTRFSRFTRVTTGPGPFCQRHPGKDSSMGLRNGLSKGGNSFRAVLYTASRRCDSVLPESGNAVFRPTQTVLSLWQFVWQQVTRR